MKKIILFALAFAAVTFTSAQSRDSTSAEDQWIFLAGGQGFFQQNYYSAGAPSQSWNLGLGVAAAKGRWAGYLVINPFTKSLIAIGEYRLNERRWNQSWSYGIFIPIVINKDFKAAGAYFEVSPNGRQVLYTGPSLSRDQSGNRLSWAVGIIFPVMGKIGK